MRVNIGDMVYLRHNGCVSAKPRKPHELSSGPFCPDPPIGFVAAKNQTEPTANLNEIWVNLYNGKVAYCGAEHEYRLYMLAAGEWFMPLGKPAEASEDLLDAVEVYLEHSK